MLKNLNSLYLNLFHIGGIGTKLYFTARFAQRLSSLEMELATQIQIPGETVCVFIHASPVAQRQESLSFPPYLHCITVDVVGIRIGDLSSNPRRGCLCFISRPYPWEGMNQSLIVLWVNSMADWVL